MSDSGLTIIASATTHNRSTNRRDGLLNAIVLVPVSPGAWQVRDSRQTPGHEGFLLGFVEERQGIFELMQVADDFRWTTFASMESAVAHIAETNDEVVDARRRGQVGWPASASRATGSSTAHLAHTVS